MKHMRLRHIQGAEETIASSPFVIQEPEQHRGAWNQVFGNSSPLEIEVGMGKGRFIMEKASANPDINYIGIERYSSVLLRGLQKRSEMDLKNIYFMCIDAKDMAEIFCARRSGPDLSELLRPMAKGPSCQAQAHIPCVHVGIRQNSGSPGSRGI